MLEAPGRTRDVAERARHLVLRGQRIDACAQAGGGGRFLRAQLPHARQVRFRGGLQPVGEARAPAVGFGHRPRHRFDRLRRADRKQQPFGLRGILSQRRHVGGAHQHVVGYLDLHTRRQREQTGDHAVFRLGERGEIDAAVGEFAQCGFGECEFGQLRLAALQRCDRFFGRGRPRAQCGQRGGDRVGRRAAFGGKLRGSRRPVRAVALRQRVEVFQQLADRGARLRVGRAVPFDFHAAGRGQRLERDEGVVARDDDLEPARRLGPDHDARSAVVRNAARTTISPRSRSRSSATSAR